MAARAIVTGQVWRPGVPGLAGAEADVIECDPLYWTGVQDYLMGNFPHTSIPEIQFLSTGTESAQVVYLKLIKTA